MTPEFMAWANRHGVSASAVVELQQLLTVVNKPAQPGVSEAAITSQVLLEASQAGVLLFRNNVGVATNPNGQPVRYGLANESHALNQRIKSADLVGIRRVLITKDMVGSTIGQFVCREVKAGGWRYSGKGREVAQMRWCELINTYGGDAAFCSNVGSFS